MDNSVDLQLLLESGRKPPTVQMVSKEIQEEERFKALLETAYEHALRKGMHSEIKIIETAIKKNERNLDAIYNFSPLMIHNRVVPPVITEYKDIVQTFNGEKLSTTGAIYKIEKQAKFSTTAPNYRQYLTFYPDEYSVDFSETPTKEMMPKNAKERAAWEKVTVKGFRDGQLQAQTILKNALNELNKDYTGMIRFHQFVLEGKISMPSISRKDLAVMNNGQAMSLDHKLLTIRTLPSFDGNMTNWNTWLKPVEYQPGKQISTVNNAD